jgi:hypothetical protein
LNAFVEQALPGKERDQVLAHVAACARCRQVVYLAQEAALASEAPESAVAGQAAPSSWRSAWLRGWRLAWVPAAACALLVGTAVLVSHRQSPSPNEVAKLAPDAERRPSPASAQQTTQPQTARPQPEERRQAQSPRLEHPGRQVDAVSAKKSMPLETQQVTVSPSTPAADAAPVAAAGTVDLSRAADKSEARDASIANLSVIELQPAAQPQLKAAGGNFKAQASAPATVNVAAAPAAPAMQTESAAVTDTVVATHLSAAKIAVERKAIPLPSGLRFVSRVETQQLELAVDTAGALFLSQDAGKTWQPIARQWTGKAVKVRIRRGRQEAGAAATATVPTIVFELVNDSGSTWISSDGKTWTKNQAPR